MERHQWIHGWSNRGGPRHYPVEARKLWQRPGVKLYWEYEKGSKILNVTSISIMERSSCLDRGIVRNSVTHIFDIVSNLA